MTSVNLSAPQQRAERAGVPYRVHVILTHRCNLACAHCYQAEHAGAELALQELETTFDALAAMGTLFLTLGGGEPLARRDFWEILAAARRRRFAVELYTNGTMVDEAAAQRLREAGVTTVSVSLHGAHAQTHDPFVRRAGAFDRVNRAIDALEAQHIPVTVKTNVTSTNARELPQMLEQFQGRSLVHLSLNRRLHPKDDGDLSPLLFGPSEEQERGVVRVQLGSLPRAELEAVLDRARQAQALDAKELSPCQAARTTFALQPNGDVTPCTQLGGMVMGNVRARPLAEIWSLSQAAGKLRAVSAASFQVEHAECRTCPFNKVCSKCMALSQSESGSLTGHSAQVCRQTKVFWSEVRRRAGELGLDCPV